MKEKQHSVPQNIMSVEFKIIGDMSMKQFAFIAVPACIGFIMFIAHVSNYITIPLTGIFLLLGVLVAFIPIDDRPLDQWITNFLITIKKPTQRIWMREASGIPAVLDIPKSPTISSSNKEIATFLYQNPFDTAIKNNVSNVDGALELKESILNANIDKINKLLTTEKIDTNATISTSPVSSVLSNNPVSYTPSVPQQNPPENNNAGNSVDKNNRAEVEINNAEVSNTKLTEPVPSDGSNSSENALSGIGNSPSSVAQSTIPDDKNNRAEVGINNAEASNTKLTEPVPSDGSSSSENALSGIGNSSSVAQNTIPDDKNNRAEVGINNAEASNTKLTEPVPSNGSHSSENALSGIGNSSSSVVQNTSSYSPNIPPPSTFTQQSGQQNITDSKVGDINTEINKNNLDSVNSNSVVTPTNSDFHSNNLVNGQNVNASQSPLDNSTSSRDIELSKIMERIKQLEMENSKLMNEVNSRVAPNYTLQSNIEQVKSRMSSQSGTFDQQELISKLPDFVKTPNVISGVIVNSDGTLISDAVVIIKDSNQKPIRAVKSNQLGQFYTRTALLNGRYNIEINAQGYKFNSVGIELTGSVVMPFIFIPVMQENSNL